MCVCVYDIYSDIDCFNNFRIKSFKLRFYKYMKIVQLIY